MKQAIIIGIILILLSITVSATTPNIISINGRLQNRTGSNLDGTYSIVFELSNDYGFSPVLYSENKTITTNNGIFFTSLTPNLTLTQYNQNVYMRMKVNSDSYTSTFNVTNMFYAKVSEVANGLSNYTIDSNVNITKNLTVGGYLYGQPLLGMLGSGIISSIQTNALSEINVSCSGLTCSYNSFIVRLNSETSNTNSKYCEIPAGTKVASNNQHNVFYVDSNCVVQVTSITSWFDTLILQGLQWDFANMVCYANSCEVINGIGLEQRRMLKQRIINFNKNHLSITEGFSKTTGVFPAFTIANGKYIYLMDVVQASSKTTGIANSIEIIIPNGTTTSWQMSDQTNINYTTCQNSTNSFLCTNTNKYRRLFLFMVGWNDSIDTSGLHQLLPSESVTYSTESACLDTVSNPITYTLPSFYSKVAVPLWAYCIRPSDTGWSSTGWIDLRTVKVGSATAISTTAFVPYLGAISNVNLGSYNITASNFIGNINASYVENVPWITSYIDTFNSTEDFTRINRLYFYNITNPLKFNNNITNITGTLVADKICRYNSTTDNIQCTYTDVDTFNTTGEMRGAVNLSNAVYQINISGTASIANSDNLWTVHNSYPSGCSANQYVSTIGDTLTCGTPIDTYNSSSEFRKYINQSTNLFNVAINSTASTNVTVNSNLRICNGANCAAIYIDSGGNLIIQ
jgi:hypothetical protein